jgi:hypothetical protein
VKIRSISVISDKVYPSRLRAFLSLI